MENSEVVLLCLAAAGVIWAFMKKEKLRMDGV